MSRKERPQLRETEKKPFNRADCVGHTTLTFAPAPSWIFWGIQVAHLAGDVYRKPGDRFERLHSLDVDVAQRIKEFGNPGAELTDEELQKLDEQKEQARKAFGSIIVAHARQLGLVETLSPEQAQDRLVRDFGLDSVAQISDRCSYHGWDILVSKSGEKHILLMPIKPEDQQISFETVDLNYLKNRDPKFLLRQVRDFEEKYAMGTLVDSITYNLNLHEISETELLPKYVEEIAHIINPVRRSEEFLSIRLYLDRMASLGGEPAIIAANFRQKLSARSAAMKDGRIVHIQDYLKHMAECPTQADEDHERYAYLLQMYNNLLSVTPKASSNLDMRILQEPDRYTFYLDRNEKRNIADREQNQKVIDFIVKTGNVVDQAQLLETLQQDLPDFHNTLIGFQEWLGNNSYEKNRYSELISQTANRISIAGKKFSLEELNKILKDKLKIAVLLTGGEFEGVYVDRMEIDGEASLSNPHLQAILPLIIIKTAQARAETKMINQPVSDYYKKGTLLHCQRLIKELIQSYEEKVKSVDETPRDITEEKAAIMSFKKNTGITDKEIAHFIELTIYRKDGAFGPEIYNQLYAGLFNALVLEKQGLIDMHSPIFKEFLKSYFPGTPDTIWQNL